ncbi:hypothetical protein RHMOL_Rhmol13G0249300 [Rhododendron molle]|uniref:Uncharacterized protein n=1 Tax=Rhododendron molle TaxID=49168 RepID=A0ACC0LBD4_RHOML|nr:hypothetical protein RHMOL_Rhmol13G0249300 [Rhododendron molle]
MKAGEEAREDERRERAEAEEDGGEPACWLQVHIFRSVAIDAGGDYSQFYSSVVFNGPCSTKLDHGVTVVGYGTSSDGTKYWLVKNSWSSGWGENGYMKMERDVLAAKEGLCEIAKELLTKREGVSECPANHGVNGEVIELK